MLVPIFVKERLYISRAPEFEDILDELRVKFTHTNPNFAVMKAMGKWTGNIQPQIRTWSHVTTKEWGECLSLPRGGTNRVRQVFKHYNVKPRFMDRRLSLPPITYLHNDIILRPDQERLAQAMFKRENCLIRSPTASGKCLAPDTPVLLYSGKVVPAKQIKVGDELMGPDSKKRTVTSCTSGYGQLYEIKTRRKCKESWICNGDHVLTLVNCTHSKFIVDISVNDYLKQSKTFKHIHKLIIQGVEYPTQYTLPLEPYFVGVWLGDGRKSLSFIEIAKPDREIYDYLCSFADKRLLQVNTYHHPDKCPAHRIVSPARINPVLNELRSMFKDGLCIPTEYLYASREQRLELLAGLLDTDGYLAGNSYYEIIQKNKQLAKDIWFLGRSLGFYTTNKKKWVKGNCYHRVTIHGEIENIPVKIKRKQVNRQTKHNDSTHIGFDVSPVRQGKYVGWTLDGDGRFLLGNFMVTHNTEVALKVAEMILKTAGPVLVLVWETELMRQWIERTMLRFGLREQDIGILGAGKKRIAPITIGMQQTLMKQGYRHAHQFGGLIADEVQRFAAPTFQKVIDIFPARYRIGVSASETRKDKKEFLIYDAFGEVADEIEKSQLIEEGKIHDVSVRLVPTTFNYGIELSSGFTEWAELPGALKDWKDFIDEMDEDEERNDLIWEFMEPCFKAGNTCLVITRRRAAAKYWNDRIHNAGYASGLLIGGNATEFNRTVDGLRRRAIQAGVGTIQKSGVGHDIKPLDRGFIINPLAKNTQLFEQVIGRLRRTCDGKRDAVLYYFWDKYCYPNDRRTICKNYPNTYLWVDDEFLPVVS